MTLYEIIRRIEATAAKQPAVNMIVENDIFKLNACADARYGVFAWTQGAHTASTESDERRFQFSLFYVDRLTDDGGNQLPLLRKPDGRAGTVRRGAEAGLCFAL